MCYIMLKANHIKCNFENIENMGEILASEDHFIFGTTNGNGKYEGCCFL